MKKIFAKLFIAIFTLGLGMGVSTLAQANPSNLPNEDKGTITVLYQNENGQTIHPATINTGNNGQTFTSQVPSIKGYALDKIQNGQNDANGPQMVYVGDMNQQMVLVYKTVDDTAAKQTVNDNQNSKATTNDETKAKKSVNKTKSSSDNTKVKTADNTNSNKQTKTNQVKHDTKKADTVDKNSDKKANDDKDNKSDKDEAAKKDGHGVLLYSAIAVIVVGCAGIFAWRKLRK